jgi:hypothetical protein
VFLIGNYIGPWGLRFNPFLIAQSGKPFDITIASDPYNDGFYNHRPGVVSSSLCTPTSTQYAQTSYGCFDTEPNLTPGEKLVTNNAGNGPAAVALNLRISRTFGIGPKIGETSGNNNPGGGPPGGGGGGRGGGGPGGGPGGGFGPGGFGGGGRPQGMGGPVSTRKYNLTFSAQALNLFNDIDKGTPVGTVSAPYQDVDGTPQFVQSEFGTSTNLQGGIFSQGSAARRIFLQAVFSF